MKKFVIFSVSLFFPLILLYSGSFQAPSIGARATGMGGAYTAVANDPLALYWNPAGMGLVKGKVLSAGFTSVKGRAKYKTVENLLFSIPEGEVEKNKVPWVFIPHSAFVMEISDKFSMGAGLFTPYGLKQIWEENSYYKYNAIRSEIWLNVLQVGVSYRFGEKLFMGGCLGKGYATMRAKQTALLSAMGFPIETKAKLSSTSESLVGSLGILWNPAENWDIGVVWHSSSSHNFKGEVDFSPKGMDSFERDMEMKFTFPQSASLGVAYKGFENWLFSFQIDWTDWSVLDKLEEKLDESIPLFDPVLGVKYVDEIEIERDWKDTFSYHFGAEYLLNDKFSLRFGYMWDPSPVPEETLDPLMFDVSVHRFSLGIGYRAESWSLDLAFMYSQGLSREVEDSENAFPTDGEYWGSSQMVELTFNCYF